MRVKVRDRSASNDRSSGTVSCEDIIVKKLNEQPASSSDKRYDPNRYIKLISVKCSIFSLDSIMMNKYIDKKYDLA